LALFEYEFLSWIVQPFTYEFRMLLQQYRKWQDTAHVALKITKVNLPAHAVCTTPSMEKKKSSHLLWLFPLNSSASFEKCGFNPVSRTFFIRGLTSLIEFAFFHFISTRAENPCS